jgi:hypothetical protein
MRVAHLPVCLPSPFCARSQRARQEAEARKSRGAAERERLRMLLEDDRRQRALQQELTAHHGPAHAHVLPSEQAPRASRGGAAAQEPHEEDED